MLISRSSWIRLAASCALLCLLLTPSLRAAGIQPAVKSIVQYEWSNVQVVGGGFVTGILGNPQLPDIRYARTALGGTFRWNPATKRWDPLLDFLNFSQVNYIGTESFALDPQDPARLYLAVGTYSESFGENGAILISDDYGNHFDIVPLPIKMGSNDVGSFGGERLAVDPNNSNIIYFGSRLNGLWRSMDRGKTWAQVASFPVTGPTGPPTLDPGVGVMFELFEKNGGQTQSGASKVAYIGVSQPTSTATPGLYVTTDAGQSFQPVPGQPLNYYYLNTGVEGPDGSLYLVYGSGGGSLNSVGPYGLEAGQVWKYTPPANGAAAGVWTDITPPKPGPYPWGFGSVAVNPNDPRVIMISTMDRFYPTNDEIYRSTDGGQSWEGLEKNAVYNASRSPWITSYYGAVPDAGNWVNHLWINPWNPNEVLYATQETIWGSNDIGNADGVPTTPGTVVDGNATHWSIHALGIENSSVLALVSPPAGPAHLISGMSDIGSFTHTDLHRSPAGGVNMNPNEGTTSGIDFAGAAPLTIARVGFGGGYSQDGGLTWTPFPTNPAMFLRGNGNVAVAANGSAIYWQFSDVGSQAEISKDNGATWHAVPGSPSLTSAQIEVVADRKDPSSAYVYDPATGIVYRTSNQGHTLQQVNVLATGGTMSISPAAKGDLWFASSQGLEHSTDGGTSWNEVGNVTTGYSVAFGAPRPGSAYPAIYLYGQVNGVAGGIAGGVTGFFRSTDAGNTFIRINDDQHQYGNAYIIQGDPRAYGRIYIGTTGRGIVMGESAF